MGDIAEMMLEGILDANGEYTGRNPGHPVYPKGWFGNKEIKDSYPNVKQVKNFLMSRGIPRGEQQKNLVLGYGKHVNTTQATKHAVENWKDFKKYIDEQIGYVKPSKQKKDGN